MPFQLSVSECRALLTDTRPTAMQKLTPQDTDSRADARPSGTIGAASQPWPFHAWPPAVPSAMQFVGVPQERRLAQAHAATCRQIWPRLGDTSVQVLVAAFQVAAIATVPCRKSA